MTTERDSPLLAATRHNHTDVALALIQAGARLNSVDHSGDTPLLNAIDRGNRAVVRVLLRAGADPNLAHEDAGGRTPLLSAVEAGRRRIVKLLLNAGASPNVADEEGTTPLMMVEDVEIAQALLARGAQRGARNKAGRTALDIARQEGRGEIAQLLEGRAGVEAAGS